jgi:hypothetical protein
MKKNVKIAIGVAGLVGAGVVGYFIWKAVQEKNGSGSGTTATGNDGQPVTVRNIRQLKKPISVRANISNMTQLRERLIQQGRI